jgi:AraC family transcriptional regulator of adaptative response/methylated-DNA-[protein]-cysteine methyltransferase
MHAHYYTTFPSVVGDITAVASDTAIVYACIGDGYRLDDRFTCLNAQKADKNPLLEKFQHSLFDALLSLPIQPQGTPFQQRVWQALRAIPRGRTASYTDIAQQIGKPKAFRAVAAACKANPIALLIPCHRVLNKNGGISGYRWGVTVKQQLLAREQK